MRELLKEASEMLSNIESELPNYYLWETHELVQRIESELNKPEPEPVAWLSDRGTIWHDKTDAIDDSDGFIEPLYTTQPDQSARIAELSQLEAEIINTLRELIKAQEYIKELAAEHSVLVVKNRDLEQQLAGLQAKRKPLTSDQVREVYRTAFPKGPYIYTNDAFVFARAIEQHHGITE